MKLKDIKWLVALFLIGCGTDKSSDTSSALPAWPETQHLEATASCIEGALTELEPELAKRYCTCIMIYIEAHWSHETYYSDDKYGESLVENGQVDSCYESSL